jgi:hypothetical protein
MSILLQFLFKCYGYILFFDKINVIVVVRLDNIWLLKKKYSGNSFFTTIDLGREKEKKRKKWI